MNDGVVLAAAEGIVKATDQTLLFENSGHIILSLDWAYSLLRRMGYMKIKATTKVRTALTQEEFMLSRNDTFDRSRKMVGPDWSKRCSIFPVDSSRERNYKS